MMWRPSRAMRITLTSILLLLPLFGFAALQSISPIGKITAVAYFDNSNGIYVGDDVVILGVKVGQIDKIEPQPQQAKITFSIGDTYHVPADVNAVILSPKLVTSRAIQLTPAYTGGPTLANGSLIPLRRTAVPVDFDDLRRQLAKLADTLQPTQPGDVSPLGDAINTAADNLRGQGARIRDTVIKLSQTISAFADHSGDVFATVKNLSILVSALHDSAELMSRLNNNLAAVTGLLADDPDEVSHAVTDLNNAVGDLTGFVNDNREALGTASDKLSSISKAVVDSIDDVKQTLHLLPNVIQNLTNIYEPAHGALSGILAVPNFANPITFLCGAIQAASRLNNEQSAKLCVQYLAPIIKNRQYNFLPLGLNPFVNAQARPNEVTYSEDWMRPDFQRQPPAAAPSATTPEQEPVVPVVAAPPEPAPVTPNPTDGLTALMTPPRAGG